MLTQEEDMEAKALEKRGWSISAIARHLGRDRKTIRAHLNGEREAGVRRRSVEDPFDRVEPYVRQRLADDPHVWATTLFDEVGGLGYDRAYQTFTRQLRDRGLRPHCEPCAGVKGRATVEIDHPPGEEIQWDWGELGACPWDPTLEVSMLVGALAHSGKGRAWLTHATDQPHLVEGLDQVLRRFGGTARRWRVDRMATVINPQTGKLQASFAPVAKHYGVTVVPCPPRRGNRKGVVEKHIHFLTQRWWRTLRARSLAEAQASLDQFCARVGDARPRGELTVADAAQAEPLLALPELAFPAGFEATRMVMANALVNLDGNRYSVPPALVGGQVLLRWRLGGDALEIHTLNGTVTARHRLAPRGAQRTTRLPEHTAALEKVVLGAFSTDRPCRSKANRPPSDAALTLAAELLGERGADPVIDLGAYQRLIDAESGDAS